MNNSKTLTTTTTTTTPPKAQKAPAKKPVISTTTSKPQAIHTSPKHQNITPEKPLTNRTLKNEKTEKPDSVDALEKQMGKLKVEDPGYESDTETTPKKKRSFRPRLLIGEANFSYARAMVTKKLETLTDSEKSAFGKSIIATAYEPAKELKQTYQDFTPNLTFLKSHELTLYAPVDGTKLHTYKQLKDRRFKRIHFNFPHDRSNFKDRTLPPIIASFFASAATLQQPGDRIHMALPKPSISTRRKFYQGYVYGIYDAAKAAGYKLVKKRRFGSDRYPGYSHRETGNDDSARVAQTGREYIFQKLKKGEKAPAPVSYYAYNTSVNCLNEPTTDSDSSDYYDSDSE